MRAARWNSTQSGAPLARSGELALRGWRGAQMTKMLGCAAQKVIRAAQATYRYSLLIKPPRMVVRSRSAPEPVPRSSSLFSGGCVQLEATAVRSWIVAGCWAAADVGPGAVDVVLEVSRRRKSAGTEDSSVRKGVQMSETTIP